MEANDLEMTVDDIDEFLKNGLFMGMGPENVLLAWGKPKKLKNPIEDQICFFVSDFYLEEKTPWYVYPQTRKINRSDLIVKLQGQVNQPQLDLRWQAIDKNQFAKSFENVQLAIKNGVVEKAVPVVFSTAHGSVTKAMRAKMVCNLLVNAQKVIPYGFFAPEEGVLGATPETLFSYDVLKNEIRTMALAGTRSTDLEKSQSIIHDSKEVFEHELVVKGLKEKLKSWGERHCSPTYIWDLGTLVHLRTDITVELESTPKLGPLFTDLIHHLHPTAALGVSPVQTSWQIMREFDGATRRLKFGAPFGVLNPKGTSQILVAIRNLQWSEAGLQIGSGCGVVGQSVFENEWYELQLKQNYVRAKLGI